MVEKKAGQVSYVPELDGFRAFAVFAVLLSHYGLGTTLSFITHKLPWGLMGVWAFFVLSGFLITNILCDCRARLAKKDSEFCGTIFSFYIRRFLRIFPIYYTTLILLYAFGDPEFRNIVWYHAFFLSNTYSAVYVGGLESNGLIYPASGHFWSLSVEEQFYTLWPVFILLMPRSAILPATYTMILLAPLTRAILFASGYQNAILYLPTCVDALGFGSLLALSRSQIGHFSNFLFHRLVIQAAFLLCLCCIGMLLVDIAYQPVMVVLPTVAAFIFAALINALLDQRLPATGRVLRLDPLVWIGKISYGIYLLHTFIANAFISTLPTVDSLAGPLRFVVLSAVTTLVCAVIWKYFEKPINDLKHFFPYPGQEKTSKYKTA